MSDIQLTEVENTKERRVQRKDLNLIQKAIIKADTRDTRLLGIIFSGRTLLRARCYFTVLGLMALNTIAGIGRPIAAVIQYIYLPERAFNNSKGKLIKLIDGYYSESNILNNLIISASEGNSEMVKLLIKNGIYYGFKNKDGYDALMMSSFNGHLKTVKLLVEKGANINSQNNEGSTPLMLASLQGHLNTVKFLIEKGATISVKDNQGYKALDFAKKKGDEAIIDLVK